MRRPQTKRILAALVDFRDCPYRNHNAFLRFSGVFKMSSTTASRALATAVWPASVSRIVQAVILVLLGTAILAISAKVKVPFWPVPMTLQTLAVLLIGAAYGSRLAVATVLAYIAEGMLGLPVFTNTPPVRRRPRLHPRTDGRLHHELASWSRPSSALATDRGWDRSPLRLGAAMLVAVVVQFAMGFAWLAWFARLPNGAAGIGVAKAFAGGVAPFVLGDLLKVVFAAGLYPGKLDAGRSEGLSAGRRSPRSTRRSIPFDPSRDTCGLGTRL